ncbi:MAG TPA: hypothetical protein PK605_05255 [Ignavibacteria bacterium]|nr:hypothetical protein [Bacteroidota bacterium]HCN38314.1 hypothetical protein [Bacteroidota bacterium]HRF66840.1 hypothetical protein [Ignavibacteria bacterium]HRJ03791.1 hypothetical protein [Ignavibacteria bacterium]
MKTILALQGNGKKGKTTTIKLLRKKLIKFGFVSIYPDFKNKADYMDILKRKGKIVGITTQGDLYEIIDKKLNIMFSYDCLIMVCACRSKGKTIKAVVKHKEMERRFIPKTSGKTAKQRLKANNNDAKYFFKTIKQLI